MPTLLLSAPQIFRPCNGPRITIPSKIFKQIVHCYEREIQVWQNFVSHIELPPRVWSFVSDSSFLKSEGTPRFVFQI